MRLLGTTKKVSMHLDSGEWATIVDIIEAVYGEAILGKETVANLRYAYGEPVGGQQLEKLSNAIEQFIEDNELGRVDMGYRSIDTKRLGDFVYFMRETKEFITR